MRDSTVVVLLTIVLIIMLLGVTKIELPYKTFKVVVTATATAIVDPVTGAVSPGEIDCQTTGTDHQKIVWKLNLNNSFEANLHPVGTVFFLKTGKTLFGQPRGAGDVTKSFNSEAGQYPRAAQ